MLKENDDQKLLVEIFMSELSRIRYLLRAYLRVRLHKCERHVMHILDNADIAARLSEREAQYARDFFVLFGSHMKAAAANHMPGGYGSCSTDERSWLAIFREHCWCLCPHQQGEDSCCKLVSLVLLTMRSYQHPVPAFIQPTHTPLVSQQPLASTEAFSSLVRQAAAHPAKDMVPAPDLDRHVFARVLEDRGNVTVDEEG